MDDVEDHGVAADVLQPARRVAVPAPSHAGEAASDHHDGGDSGEDHRDPHELVAVDDAGRGGDGVVSGGGCCCVRYPTQCSVQAEVGAVRLPDQQRAEAGGQGRASDEQRPALDAGQRATVAGDEVSGEEEAAVVGQLAPHLDWPDAAGREERAEAPEGERYDGEPGPADACEQRRGDVVDREVEDEPEPAEGEPVAEVGPSVLHGDEPVDGAPQEVGPGEGSEFARVVGGAGFREGAAEQHAGEQQEGAHSVRGEEGVDVVDDARWGDVDDEEGDRARVEYDDEQDRGASDEVHPVFASFCWRWGGFGRHIEVLVWSRVLGRCWCGHRALLIWGRRRVRPRRGFGVGVQQRRTIRQVRR